MKKNKQNIDSKIVSKMYAIYIVFILLSAIVVFKIIHINFYFDKSKINSFANLIEKKVKGDRGTIFSCEEESIPLSISVPIFELGMDPMIAPQELWNKKLDSLCLLLSNRFGDKTAEEYKEFLNNSRKRKKQYIVLQRSLTLSDKENIITYPIFREGRYKGGVIFNISQRRIHTYGMAAERTLGYINQEGNGVGIEDAYEEYLRGVEGTQLVKKVGNRYIPYNEDYIVKPIKGADVYSNIRLSHQLLLQENIKNVMIEQGAQYATAILMEVETGKIRAISNLSRNNKNQIGEFFNHAIGTSVEPGSTFKLASLLVALKDEKINIEQKINTFGGKYQYYDKTMFDDHFPSQNKISVWEAFANSLNVSTSRMIVNNYSQNPDSFINGLESLGLTKKFGLQIKGEGNSFIKHTNDSTWSGLSLAWMSIGYEILLTPLQILGLYNAIANNGEYVKPQFVSSIWKNNKQIKKFEKEIFIDHIANQNVIDDLKFMLSKVIEVGTAKHLYNPNLLIAGKTGTTQMAITNKGYGTSKERKHFASFCGYFPANSPKYTMIVLVAAPNKSIYGSEVAATTFYKIANDIANIEQNFYIKNITKSDRKYITSKNGNLEDLRILYSDLNTKYRVNSADCEWSIVNTEKNYANVKKININKNINVIGMGLRDALKVLEENKYIVQSQGYGSVYKQEMDYSKMISKIYLK